jgi:hypothetical protein
LGHDRRVVLAASGPDAVYDTLLALHVLCAIVGFASVAISGVYGATARHLDRQDAREETARYFRSSGKAEWLVLVVPFLGAAALSVRPSGSDFGDAWVVAAALVWLTAAGLLLGVIRPAERQIRSAVKAVSAETPAGADSSPRAVTTPSGKRLMWAAAGCDVLFVIALLLMVYQPA